MQGVQYWRMIVRQLYSVASSHKMLFPPRHDLLYVPAQELFSHASARYYYSLYAPAILAVRAFGYLDRIKELTGELMEVI